MLGKSITLTKICMTCCGGDLDPHALVSMTTVSGNDCTGFLYGVLCPLLTLMLVNVLYLYV